MGAPHFEAWGTGGEGHESEGFPHHCVRACARAPYGVCGAVSAVSGFQLGEVAGVAVTGEATCAMGELHLPDPPLDCRDPCLAPRRSVEPCPGSTWVTRRWKKTSCRGAQRYLCSLCSGKNPRWLAHATAL